MRMRFCISISVLILGIPALGAQPISSIEELQLIGNDPAYPLDGNYVITQDIDASDTSTWNDGKGFIPIGYLTSPYPGIITPNGFKGTLNGQGYSISGLHIQQEDNPFVWPIEGVYIGLFLAIDTEGIVEDLRIENAQVKGKANVGILAGKNEGSIHGCHVSGTVIGIEGDFGAESIGGLVGQNSALGSIKECRAAGTVLASDVEKIGGLVGLNNGTISGSHADNDVSGLFRVGGLVGANGEMTLWKSDKETLAPGTIKDCHASGTVIGLSSVGGLVGVSGQGGGPGSLIADCSATGAVGSPDGLGILLGGLIGSNTGDILRSYAEGTVSGNERVGGLAGESNQGRLYQCYASGNVDANGNNSGGLVGLLTGNVEQCFATGNVSSNGTEIGGLVGNSQNAIVRDSYASGQVQGLYWVGGLIGFPISCEVENCYASGSVEALYATPEGEGAGGLTALGASQVLHSFWDVESSGQFRSEGGQGLSTSDMKQKSTFKGAGWDFLFVWGIEDGVSYPCLQWVSQSCGGDERLSVVISGGDRIRRATGVKHTFTAIAQNGIGNVHYQWYFDGGDKSAVPIIGANEFEFSLLGVDASDSGWYHCEVSDDHFTAVSPSVYLEVVGNLPAYNTTMLLLLFTVFAGLLYRASFVLKESNRIL